MEEQQKPTQKKRRRFPWIRAIAALVVSLVLSAAVILLVLSTKHVVAEYWLVVIPIIFAIFGQLLPFYQWLFPISSEAPSAPSQSPSLAEPARQDEQIKQQTPIWNVPYRHNPFFTGREELLKHLHDNLTSRKAAALTQALRGLGGIGKTQTAVEYAYRYRDEYHEVLWVSAAARGTLITSFLDLARLLNLPEKGEQDQNITVQAVKRWLVQHDHWLLIVDNADDLALAEEFLPTGGKGHLLLTTRAQAPGSLANGIDVEEMDTDEGMLLLLRRAKVLAIDAPLTCTSATDRAAAESIVREMGGLPLALDQAGAYIEETHCGVSAYLVSYRQRQAELLKRRGGTGKEHPESVATTWSLSFERVEQLSPMAADLLRVCAFLAPDALPEELFVEGASELGPLFQPLATDATRINDAVGVLLRYSFVKRDLQERTLSIHRLVQAVLIEGMDQETRHLWAERTVRAVNEVFPTSGSFDHWDACAQYLPHVLVALSHLQADKITLAEAADVLRRAGWYLGERGQNREAEELLQRAFVLQEQGEDTDGLAMARVALTLGWLYNKEGKYAQAEPLYQRALSINEKAYGPDHPEVATDLNNLALLYKAQGKYAQAEPLYQCALAIREQQLGPEHPDTASSLDNLARLYHAQGKYKQAELLSKRALAIREQQLGPEHPYTATSLNTLAHLYHAQGKYEQAEPLYQRALAIREQQLGPEHPDTASSLDNLARLYHAQGKYKQAEPLSKRALAIDEQHLGPEHPYTATSLNTLAHLYHAQGKYEQAEPLYQRALAICEQQLGPEHPNTMTIRKNYDALVENMKQKAKGQH